VVDLLSREVDHANRALARPSQVKHFKLLPFELDPEHGDTTATRKIQRHKMDQMFGSLIAEMYSTDEEEVIRATSGSM